MFDPYICPRCHDTAMRRGSYCKACQRERDASYVTADSNGTPYHTFCGEPVVAHRGNAPHTLGKCPRRSDD